MNDQQRQRGNEIAEEMKRINEDIRMMEKNMEHANEYQHVVISISGSVASVKVQNSPTKRNGWDYLPFSAVQLMQLCIFQAKKQIDELQDEYEKL